MKFSMVDIDSSFTFAIIKPDAFAKKEEIMGFMRAAGFNIASFRERRLTDEDVAVFYAEHCEKPFFAGLKAHMTSGLSLGLMLAGATAVATTSLVRSSKQLLADAPSCSLWRKRSATAPYARTCWCH